MKTLVLERKKNYKIISRRRKNPLQNGGIIKFSKNVNLVRKQILRDFTVC